MATSKVQRKATAHCTANGLPHTWEALSNASWGQRHTEAHGDRSGYVVTAGREGKAILSVIGLLFASELEIQCNARIAQQSLHNALLVEKLAAINPEDSDGIVAVIAEAKQLSQQLLIHI